MSEPGRHSDGGGLYLQVSPSGAKSWLFMFKRDNRRREVGLGSVRDVPLVEARQKAATARKLVDVGKDPLEERNLLKAAVKAEETKPKFGAFADDLIESIEGGFRNAKHRYQWRQTLGPTYCASIRDKPLNDIGTEDVLAILQPIWLTKSETASRIRGRIERVLCAARARGLRDGENPARWRGHLDSLLAKRKRLQRGHHPAMPYAVVPLFMGRLRASGSVSSMALEFVILTASRSGEVLGAQWAEIDREARIWTVPDERMKAGRQHRVPLTDRMLTVLAAVEQLRHGPYVFPGQKEGKPLSTMALEMVLRRMNVGDATVHGFRSAFRDWAGEETIFAREIAEAALAHSVGDAVERAYRRGDALEKRRILMSAWEAHCMSSASPQIG